MNLCVLLRKSGYLSPSFQWAAHGRLEAKRFASRLLAAKTSKCCKKQNIEYPTMAQSAWTSSSSQSKIDWQWLPSHQLHTAFGPTGSSIAPCSSSLQIDAWAMAIPETQNLTFKFSARLRGQNNNVDVVLGQLFGQVLLDFGHHHRNAHDIFQNSYLRKDFIRRTDLLWRTEKKKGLESRCSWPNGFNVFHTTIEGLRCRVVQPQRETSQAAECLARKASRIDIHLAALLDTSTQKYCCGFEVPCPQIFQLPAKRHHDTTSFNMILSR